MELGGRGGCPAQAISTLTVILCELPFQIAISYWNVILYNAKYANSIVEPSYFKYSTAAAVFSSPKLMIIRACMTPNATS